MDDKWYTIGFKEAMQIITDAMKASKQDQIDLGTIDPESEVECLEGHTSWRIYTRLSRNPNLSSNGGDYHYWTTVRLCPDGFEIEEDWSADRDYSEWGGRSFFCPAIRSAVVINCLMYNAFHAANKES